MKSTSVDKVVFHSPVNLEGSWGARNISKQAESEMELFFSTDNTGFIEWIIDELDIVEHIGLTFEIGRYGERTLTDYDGVFDLPTQAMDLLEKNGVDVTEMRTTLAD